MKVFLSNYKTHYIVRTVSKNKPPNEQMINDLGELKVWLIANLTIKDQIYLDPTFIIFLKNSYPVLPKRKLFRFHAETIEKLYHNQFIPLKHKVKKTKNSIIILTYLINKNLLILLQGFTKHIIWQHSLANNAKNKIIINDNYILINTDFDLFVLNIACISKSKIINELEKYFYGLNSHEHYLLINKATNDELATEINKTFVEAISEKK